MLDETIVSELEKRQTDIRSHLRRLYDLVVSHNYKIVVELGAGQSTYVLTAAVNKTRGSIFSVDKDQLAYLRDYPEGAGRFVGNSRYHYINRDDLEEGENFHVSVDFLFIDSDHDFDHVYRTLEIWAPKVRRGGIIAMHDTDHTAGHAVGVKPALEKYLAENPGIFTVEHIKGNNGLSVLTKEK